MRSMVHKQIIENQLIKIIIKNQSNKIISKNQRKYFYWSFFSFDLLYKPNHFLLHFILMKIYENGISTFIK